jgi:hypothetical protein
MEAVIQEIDVEELTSIFNIPATMRNNRVEVTIRPIENEVGGCSRLLSNQQEATQEASSI